MPTYLTAPQIKRSTQQLGHSRAKRTSPFDFLIVKRTLAIKNSASAPIAESEQAFVTALEELGGTGLGDADHYYLNPFAISESGKSGYRPARYRSNGTNSTISGTPWQRVISLTPEKPRRASLASGYEAELPKLILGGDKKKPLPKLVDAAIWYWRGQDLDAVIAGTSDDHERLQRLQDRFVADVGLTPNEISAVFDPVISLSGPPDEPVFSSVPPSPADYLPPRAVVTEEVADDGSVEVSRDIVTALAAKNFLILTGPSGTGKSRAALKLAEGLQRQYAEEVSSAIFELIPVGPDWTSPKRILGFRTPFGKERKVDGVTTHESYELTNALRLLLRASHPDAADIPHFLIFDEMNLSHVERYFAPFLSLMEASGILDAEGGLSLISADDLKLISDLLQDEDETSWEAAAAKQMIAEGRDFILPPNLFFVGTINVDETTYMFSPKVLDRAHVIELGSQRPSSYLSDADSGEPTDVIGISNADQVLKRGIARREGRHDAVRNPATILQRLTDEGFDEAELKAIQAAIITALDGCYDLLAPVGFPFGYRVAKEVFVYVTTWIETQHETTDDKASALAAWPRALDKALLQKVLPKIHGNRRSLGDSLKAVSAFLAGGDTGSTPAASYTIGSSTRVGIPAEGRLVLPGDHQLSLSRNKLDLMHDRLVTVGYISFVS